MKGKTVTIRINLEIRHKAKEMGLNISKVCENSLREAVAKLEGPNPKNRA